MKKVPLAFMLDHRFYCGEPFTAVLYLWTRIQILKVVRDCVFEVGSVEVWRIMDALSQGNFGRFREVFNTRNCATNCSIFSLTYELHQQLQTYILFLKYRELIRSTLKIGKVLPELSQAKCGIQHAKQSTDSHVNSYILIMWCQKGQNEQ